MRPTAPAFAVSHGNAKDRADAQAFARTLERVEKLGSTDFYEGETARLLAKDMAEHGGLVLPREAVLYDENGAYVYKQLAKKTAADDARYAPVKVKLLLPYGDGWLVDGVDDDDEIVVHGAGVLWSLQGMGAQQHDDDDD